MKKIFISYTREDKEWKDRILQHLRVLEREGYCEIWDDQHIDIGNEWLKDVKNALETADVAIMMISAAFLDSNFVREVEMPRIFERWKTEGLMVIPLIVKECFWRTVQFLSAIQVFNDGRPLSEGNEADSHRQLRKLTEMIFNIITGNSEKLVKKGVKTVLITDLPSKRIQLIGRKEDLKELAQQLKETDQVLLVNGMGGIGKTELCKRFFLNHYQEYAFAGWINYMSSIKESMVNAIYPNLVNIDKKDTLDDQFRKIMAFLKQLDNEILLVIDDIEDQRDEYLDILTTLPWNFKLLVNSRLNLENFGFKIFTLDFLTDKCCKVLFYNFYKCEENDEIVSEIIKLCGKHTLTVELLARTAQNEATKLKPLYESLKKMGFNLNDVISTTVHTFWHNEKARKRFFDHLLKIFNLSNITKAELRILINLSVLPAVFISIENFSKWMSLKDKDDINSLVEKGWLRKYKMNILLHQVIAEVIRYRTNPNAKKCINLIKSIGKNLYLKPEENPLDKKKFVIFAESILQHLDENIEDLAILGNNLSLIYKELEDWKKAENFQLKAKKIWENVLRDKHNLKLAVPYHNLASIYRASGRLDEALEFQSKAIKIYEDLLDKNNPELAAPYNNLASIYKDLDRLEEALDFQRKAIKICEKMLDENHPHLATCYTNLAEIYRELKRLKKARDYQLEAVRIYLKLPDKNDPRLGKAYRNLSHIYKELGDNQNSYKCIKKAFDIYQCLYANDHPKFVRVKESLKKMEKLIKE